MLSFSSWLGGLNPPRRNRRALLYRPRRSLKGRALAVEALEDRTVPAFAAPVHYAVQDTPEAIVADYFNDDEFLDLAIANTSSSSVSVLLGNGNGTFEPAVNSSAGFYPLSLAVGDFNDDGKMDLASANLYDVNVMLGNGDGTFAEPTSYWLGSYPQSVAVGDFDGDGTLDLGVTSNLYYGYYYYYYGYYSSFANVLIGSGDGDFAAPATSWAGFGFHNSAAVGDFNGDGLQDFAAANWDYWTVTVMQGDGTGYFNSFNDFSVGVYPWAVATGDLNGDTQADLVVANYYGNDVSVLHGTGGGGFAPAAFYPVGTGPTSVVLEDLNADGLLDIATTNRDSNSVSVLRGRSDGGFVPALHAPAGAGAYAIAVDDFNGDGWLDAATANLFGDTASVLINDQSWPPPPPPVASVNDMTVTEGDSGTSNLTFTVSLSSATDVDVTIHYDTADITAVDGSDYVAASGDVTIPAGQTSGEITIAVMGDQTAEPTETFAVNLSAPVNATLGDATGIGTIIDNDLQLSINDVSGKEGNGKSTSFTFTVNLSGPSSEVVTVNFATANGTATAGSDYQTRNGTLTFAAGVTSMTITVTVIPDKLRETDETFFVNLSGASGNASIDDAQGIGTIVDDDNRGKNK